ncbi:MAG: hypothetical protein ACAH59_01550 [Pseudobdellovibrionaceae bacterium]
MIYGRRFFEKNRQRLSNFEKQAERQQSSQKSMQSLYQQFQHRYAWHFVLAVVGPFLLFSLPCVYFIFDNYDIFIRLAYDVRPDLLQHLEREKNILFGLMTFTAVSSSVFCYWLTVKLMGLIAGPIWAIERHMKRVTLGDWSTEDFQTRTKDEFQSLVSTYSYLYRTLRVHTQAELTALESIGLDPRDRQTYMTLKNLIEMKRSQLGLPNSNAVPAEQISSAPSKRHAS